MAHFCLQAGLSLAIFFAYYYLKDEISRYILFISTGYHAKGKLLTSLPPHTGEICSGKMAGMTLCLGKILSCAPSISNSLAESALVYLRCIIKDTTNKQNNWFEVFL